MFGLSSLRLGIYAVCAVAIIAGLFKLHDSIGDAREVKVRHEYDVIAQEQEKKNAEQKRKDDQATADTKATYEQALNDLRRDTRIASLNCVRNAPRPREVPRTTDAGPGAAREESANLSRETTPDNRIDVGPAIDALTRECDALAVRHSALVDFLMGTR